MKKLNSLRLLLLYVSLGLCLAACDKDEDNNPNPDPDQPGQTACQLTKVTEEGDDEYEELEYNAQGYLSKAIVRGAGSNAMDEYELYTYNTDNQVVKMERYDDGELDDDYNTYEYTNSLLTTINRYDGSTISNVTTLKYDTDKRVIKSSSGGEDDGVIFKTTYTYDSKGNVTKEENFRNSVLTYAYTYENYDDKHRPYSAIKGVPGILLEDLSQNNPGKMTESYDSNGDGILQPDEQSEVTTYTYKYNSNGFPTEVTETDEDGPEVTTFTYTCK